MPIEPQNCDTSSSSVTLGGLCLVDNTPIAITLDDGVIVSWTDLLTGIVTPGNPPAGAGVCEVPSTVTVDIEPLNCAVDSVTICPGDDPIVVTGTTGDLATQTTLAAILAELSQKLETGGEVTLSPASLAALENITVVVGASVEINNDSGNPIPISGTVTANLGTIDGAATETTLAAILTELGQKYEGGAIALDAPTLAALENITVTVSNPTANPETGLAKEVTLAAVLVELGQKLEPGGEVALNAATLAALENITVTVSNPTVDPATETTLTAILTELGQKLEPGGEVALNAATLAALENVTVTVSNPTANPETGLAKEVTLAALLVELGQKYEGGAIALDAGTLAALETVTVLQGTSPWVISGTVSSTDLDIRNLLFATDKVDASGSVVSLDAPTLAALETTTVNQGTSPWVVQATALDIRNLDCLTDSVTICGEVNVGTVEMAPLTCEKDAITVCPGLDPITVDGTIELGATSLAALETVAVTQGTSPWVVNVDNFPVSGTGLTDAQLRATPVPISGTVTANLGSIDGVATETTLASILTELGQKLEPGGEVALNAATLAALENITVTVSNPTTNPETGLAKEVTLAALLVELGQKYEGGPIALDTATLAALETITVLQGTSPWVVSGTVTITDGSGPVTVDGTIELGATSLAALETITVNQGTSPWVTSLDAPTLAALESITVQNGAGAAAVNIQDGGNSITVDGPLTDVQLRATPVPVSGTVAVTNATGTLTNGAETAIAGTAVQILASNANRKKYVIQNTGVANIRVGVSGVTATTGARLVPNGTLLFEMPNCPVQAIFAIRETAVDSIAYATEVT